jgi:alanyl-tRNA synthetase
MTSDKIRRTFLLYFEKRGHKIVPSSSILPPDPTVLFTTAGMQQFKEYYLGKSSPYGNKVASCQKCFRTSDIEEVGDTNHLTFLEMLGNFSFGDYFKKESIEFTLELLTKEYRIPTNKLWITYFKGDPSVDSGQVVPEDKESQGIWQKLGIPGEKMFGFDKKDNFWGPTGAEGPCGPTTEIHYDVTGKPCELGKECIPNCACGRFIELWNLVFNEYYQNREGKLTPLGQKGVDTGMGFERLVMVIQDKPSVFETDLFEPILKEISGQDERARRIIADHIKGSVFLISEGILSSNVEQGYILRRLIRRAIRYGKILDLSQNFLILLAQKVIEVYKDIYPEVKSKEADILTVIQNEEEKFEKTLELGIKETISEVTKTGQLTGDIAFNLYESYGVPLEISKEITAGEGIKVSDMIEIEFSKAKEKHQEVSRAGAEKKFGGIGKEADYEATKLHTATHLLHQALREILGTHVKQMGSDITPQRLRFDFSHSQKLTNEEIKKVEQSVNQKIKEDLRVEKKEMPYSEAIQSGALAFFKEKYPEIVTVYSIGIGKFSKEICGGPHVTHTGELGKFKIIKEESSGAGVRRIRAILESGI